MDNIKNDRYYISKIIKDLEFVTEKMHNVSIEELNANEKFVNCFAGFLTEAIKTME